MEDTSINSFEKFMYSSRVFFIKEVYSNNFFALWLKKVVFAWKDEKE